MESTVPIEERRRRIRRWLRLPNFEHVISSYYDQGGAECFICKSRIEPRDISFVVTFNGTISLRLDRGCMDLWRSEIASSARQ
jgi:hypothetical protein